jgi:hypothetical protein
MPADYQSARSAKSGTASQQGLIGQGDVGTPMRVWLFSIDAAGAGYDIAISRRGVRPKL